MNVANIKIRIIIFSYTKPKVDKRTSYDTRNVWP